MPKYKGKNVKILSDEGLYRCLIELEDGTTEVVPFTQLTDDNYQPLPPKVPGRKPDL